MTAAAVIRAEIMRFPRDAANGKFLVLLPGAIVLSLWPYAGSPLIPLFLCVFAGLEPQFNNMLYRTPREFDALSLLPVDWKVIVGAKNVASVFIVIGAMAPAGAVLAYFSPLPLSGAAIAGGAIAMVSMIFPLLVIGNIHSVQHPRRTVGFGPGDIAEAFLMLVGVASASVPVFLANESGYPTMMLAAWTILSGMFWWKWSVPRTAARILSERTQICLAE